MIGCLICFCSCDINIVYMHIRMLRLLDAEAELIERSMMCQVTAY